MAKLACLLHETEKNEGSTQEEDGADCGEEGDWHGIEAAAAAPCGCGAEREGEESSVTHRK